MEKQYAAFWGERDDFSHRISIWSKNPSKYPYFLKKSGKITQKIDYIEKSARKTYIF